LHAFQVTQDRIKAIALVHEKLYQSDDLARVEFAEYIESLITDLNDSYGMSAKGIELVADIDHVLLGVDAAIPCGMFVNELVANSLKHAFPDGRPGKIKVSLKSADGLCLLTVKDNGVGLPADLEISGFSSTGMMIIDSITKQLRGTLEVVRNCGAEFRLAFPVKND